MRKIQQPVAGLADGGGNMTRNAGDLEKLRFGSNSQQGNGDFSATILRNAVFSTIRMNLEQILPPELPDPSPSWLSL